MQTKQQERAAFALEQINQIKTDYDNPKSFHIFAQLVIGMPNMLLSNGLGQTLAFLLAKSEKENDEHKKTFVMIKTWLLKESNFHNLLNYTQQNNGQTNNENPEMPFLIRFNSVNQNEYVCMQNETLRLMEWVKRYARAFDDYKE